MADETEKPDAPSAGDTYLAPTATVSSFKSEDSTEQLITNPKSKAKSIKDVKKGHSVSSKSAEAGSAKGPRKRIVVFLGLSQVVLGALLVGAGALAVVKGAALSRVGAGLWAGCVAVVTGVVGVLAGINDCYGLNRSEDSRSPLLTAFLALSLLCVACGNSAAVLAATGLHRDSQRAHQHTNTFQDEVEAWTPALANISVLIIATAHCLVSILSICHLARRVCPCLRPRRAYDHNQFDPSYKGHPIVVHVDEKKSDVEKVKSQELCKDLEGKLQGDAGKKKKEVEYGSANSKERLVSHWLGRQLTGTSARPRGAGACTGAPAGAGVKKSRKPPHAPFVLLPAHPASTLGRMPVSVIVPPRYATLPLPPAAFAAHGHPPPPLYYPVPDTRMRRRRSPRSARQRQRRRGGAPGAHPDSQLTRSLERIHRKKRPTATKHNMTEAELKRTYTGLDRAYAEQFIAVCDETRHAAAAEHHDSLASSSTETTHRDSL